MYNVNIRFKNINIFYINFKLLISQINNNQIILNENLGGLEIIRTFIYVFIYLLLNMILCKIEQHLTHMHIFIFIAFEIIINNAAFNNS